MATKIFYNGNRIIIDGHADTADECRTLTAMCDSMILSDDFETVVYEKGHAVFERVRGGESKMFDDLETRVGALEEALEVLTAKIGTLPEGKNSVIEYVDDSNTLSGNSMKKATEALLAAEAANAKASNAEQLALNSFYMAQEAMGAVTQISESVSASIERAENAANRAEEAAKKSEDETERFEDVAAEINEKIGNLPGGATIIEFFNTVKTTAEAVANVPEHRLPYTAAELEAKLSLL